MALASHVSVSPVVCGAAPKAETHGTKDRKERKERKQKLQKFPKIHIPKTTPSRLTLALAKQSRNKLNLSQAEFLEFLELEPQCYGNKNDLSS